MYHLFFYQDKSRYLLSLFVSIIGVFFVSSTVLAQQCMPADFACVESSSSESRGSDRLLEVPPQLAVEEASQGILATDVVGSSLGLTVPSGTPLWGAIAKDFDMAGTQGLGVSNNWPSEVQAAQAAIWLCMDNGGQNCFVDITYANRCSSIALTDTGKVYWDIGVTTDNAAQITQVGCSQKYSMTCQIIYAGCSYPAP